MLASRSRAEPELLNAVLGAARHDRDDFRPSLGQAHDRCPGFAGLDLAAQHHNGILGLERGAKAFARALQLGIAPACDQQPVARHRCFADDNRHRLDREEGFREPQKCQIIADVTAQIEARDRVKRVNDHLSHGPGD